MGPWSGATPHLDSHQTDISWSYKTSPVYRVVCSFNHQLSLVFIDRPWRDGRLSWRWFTAAAGEFWTRDTMIASLALYYRSVVRQLQLPHSLWHPSRGRSGGSRSSRVDHRHNSTSVMATRRPSSWCRFWGYELYDILVRCVYRVYIWRKERKIVRQVGIALRQIYCNSSRLDYSVGHDTRNDAQISGG